MRLWRRVSPGPGFRRVACIVAAAIMLLPIGARGQEDDYVGQQRQQEHDSCVITGLCQPNSPARRVVILHWAAIAYSVSTGNSGSSNGQGSAAAAEQLALRNCATAAPDCKLLNWVSNLCLALAVSRHHGTYA